MKLLGKEDVGKVKDAKRMGISASELKVRRMNQNLFCLSIPPVSSLRIGNL
jgi:hypothetical protein